MNKRQLLAGALSASLLVSALPGLAFAQDEEMGSAAEDVQWVLNTLAGADVPEGVEVTLLLSGGQASGNAGCNSYFGAYEIDETSLTFPSPLGNTMMLCQSPAQETEDAYLPLLGATAGWAVEDGMLSLSDADGAVQLVYGEQPVDITATQIDMLIAELESLQAQIDALTTEVAAINEVLASVDLGAADARVSALEEGVAKLENQVGGVNVPKQKERITANEAAIAVNATAISELNKTVNKLRDRIKALEENDAVQDARLDVLEGPKPVQPLP